MSKKQNMNKVIKRIKLFLLLMLIMGQVKYGFTQNNSNMIDISQNEILYPHYICNNKPYLNHK